MTARDELHAYVEQIPESDVALWLRAVRSGDIALLRALTSAPVSDDEPETDEERAAVARSWEEYERGEIITQDELRRQMGV